MASRLGVPAIALAFLAAPILGFPGRLITGCPTWIAIDGGLEVLSVLGFVLVFDLVFGRGLSRRRSLGAALIGALALYGAPALPAAGAVLPYRGISLLVPVVLSACAWAGVPLAKV